MAGTKNRGSRVHRRAALAYGTGAVLLLVYGLTLLIRPAGQGWPFLDNQLVDAFEIVVALGCIAGGLVRRSGSDRLGPVLLGGGLLAWALGDVVWTLEGSPNNVSLADAFYIAFYPLAYLAIMRFGRSYARPHQATVWLDGAIAGLGAAAVTAAFAFDSILSAVGGSASSVAVNLAYPIGDLVLLALAVGTFVIAPGRPARLSIFAVGCVIMAVGDTVYLVQSAAGTYVVGTLLDLTWPAAMFLMSVSVWIPARSLVGRSDPDRNPRFVLPTLASIASLIILMLGNFGHVSTVAIGLAATTCVAVGARMALSLRRLTRLTNARHKQAITDELTSLGNRRQFLSELGHRLDALASNTEHAALALLLIDLDHFKEINDSFGHLTGDAVLKEIGPRLRGVLRNHDVVARIGGDEFAVILEPGDLAEATVIADRITKALEQPIVFETTSLHVGASIGIALAPAHAASTGELMRCADVAMYRAKGMRLRFDVYEAELDDGADRLMLMEDLRVATTDGSLTLHYQPQIDLRTGEVLACEALLRWNNPRLGLVPPDHFLSLAEECRLTKEITAWVLREAVSECQRWWSAGRRIAVAVNLLATDLLQDSLPRQVTELLESASLPPTALILEITEQMLMPKPSRAMQVIGELAECGVVVSIDDFGTGFSSLARLSELPVGELKLDRTFISRLLEDEGDDRDLALIRSAIDLGHALGMRVVAEGIERADLVDLLVELRCDRGQGFALRPPVAAHSLDLGAFVRAVRAPTGHGFGVASRN